VKIRRDREKPEREEQEKTVIREKREGGEHSFGRTACEASTGGGANRRIRKAWEAGCHEGKARLSTMTKKKTLFKMRSNKTSGSAKGARGGPFGGYSSQREEG